jgi:OFA family oxalate/formate antiporter-like MFS transporter
MTGGTALGIMSLFNGLGRLAWGTTSDFIGRKATTISMYVVYVIACMFFLRTAATTGSFWQVLIGLCLVGFSYGGYLAMMPSFTADYYGAKNVGANYGILFTAWGICGFVVPGYFARIMDKFKSAGDIGGGYNQVYLQLAIFAVVGIVLVAMVKRPVHEVSGGE